MHLFLHGGVGVLAASVLPEQPAIAVSVSWLSHYLIDRIPHWDPGIASPTAKWNSPEVKEFLSVSVPDIALCFVLGLLLPSLVPALPFGLTVACVGAAVIADAIDGMAKLTNWRLLQYHRQLHDWFHFNHYAKPEAWLLASWWWSILLHLGLFTAVGVATYLALRVNGRFPAP